VTAPPRVVTLLPGDGIGPEITAAVTTILEAAGADLVWERHDAGEESIKVSGMPLPPATLASIRRTKVCLKGPITTPVGEGFKSVNVTLRQMLDLYANLRPVKNVPGVASRYGDLDLVVVRENTESLYSGIEHVVVPGVVESIKVITEKASTRIARFAFEYARAHGRRKITIVHKAKDRKSVV
jgi:isocitrate dehydrogenase (NAD+)